MMRVLVTGATGRVGRHLVAELRNDGHDVVALTRDPASARLGPSVELVRGEPADEDSMTAALVGVDAVFLNVIGSPAGLAGALRTRAEIPAVLLSSVTAGTRSELEHARQFAKTEDMVGAVMRRVTILRPGAFMSNLLWWVEELAAGPVVRVPVAEVAIGFVAPEDVAAAARVALTEPMPPGRRIVTMLGPRLSPVQQAAILAEVLDRPIETSEVGAEEYRERHAELGEDLLDYVLATTTAPLESELVTTDLASITGREPLTLQGWATRHREDFGRAPDVHAG